MEHRTLQQDVHAVENMERAFKLATSLTIQVLGGSEMGPEKLLAWSYGALTVSGKEMVLNRQEKVLASLHLEHCALYVMAIQMDTMLENLGPQRFEAGNRDLRAASWVARLVRNAFAHDPLNPVWKLGRKGPKELLEVPGVVRLDTTALDGKEVGLMDFGGPLAILRLSEFIRTVCAPQGGTQGATQP